jgi:hypothetical protein
MMGIDEMEFVYDTRHDDTIRPGTETRGPHGEGTPGRSPVGSGSGVGL